VPLIKIRDLDKLQMYVVVEPHGDGGHPPTLPKKKERKSDWQILKLGIVIHVSLSKYNHALPRLYQIGQ
jgi:hypothetical protein